MHAAIRATLLPEIIRLLQSEYGRTEEKALDEFYTSATVACFSDDDTGLYGQSAWYLENPQNGKAIFIKGMPGYKWNSQCAICLFC